MSKYDGVYQDGRGRWYVKVWLGRDPLTGRQQQVTKRGFATAADAARARRKALEACPRVALARGRAVGALHRSAQVSARSVGSLNV